MSTSKCDPESLQKPVAGIARAEPEAFPWFPSFAFLFLTYNCVQAVYRAGGDRWTVAFVVSAYSALVLLFWCLRELERLPRDGSRGREERRLKLAVWVLAMVLNGLFSYHVAGMVAPALAAVIWAVAGLTTLSAFYAFFIYREPVAMAPDAAGSKSKPRRRAQPPPVQPSASPELLEDGKGVCRHGAMALGCDIVFFNDTERDLLP